MTQAGVMGEGARRRPGSYTTRPLACIWVVALIAALAVVIPQSVSGVAPGVREVSPANITIDGSSSDWTTPALDLLAEMFEVAKPDHRLHFENRLLTLAMKAILCSYQAALRRNTP